MSTSAHISPRVQGRRALSPAGPITTSGFNIGPHRLESPWILAPMAGVSQMPYRLIAREMGAAAAPTELVSVKGLMYGNDKTKHFLAHAPEESPFWVQIFGGIPEDIGKGAAKAVEMGAAIIDINMGCPVRKVTKSGAGSALMNDSARAAEVVAAAISESGVPVTVKMRAGFGDNVNAVEVAQAVVAAGASAVALHPRTRSQGYSGKADWSLIKEVVAAVDVPVIGNGDVFCAADGFAMIEQTRCAGVMVGRGALGNPWLFRGLCGHEEIPQPQERLSIVQRHLAAHLEHTGDELRGIRRFRPQLAWYAGGLRGASAFRRKVQTLDSLDALKKEIDGYFGDAAPTAQQGSERDLEVGPALG